MNGLTQVINGFGGAIIAVAAGVAIGRVLTIAVGRWFGGARSGLDRLVEAMAVCAAVGLWWWEVRLDGLAPRTADGGLASAESVASLARWASHLLFFGLLSAATWIDMRERVIPDWITVTGVVLGLVAAFVLPDPFLPIGWEMERSFAPPVIVPDLLGAFGGLRSVPSPAWLSGSPHGAGLLFAMSVFGGWWFLCTAPFTEPAPGRARSPITEPRNQVLVVGVVCLVAAWWCGGERFHAMQSSLIGLAVSAGLTWAVREGASRALGREAMGFGDVTLMAMIGTWIGWQPSVLVFFLATFIGLAHGLMGLLLHRDHELPYGPSLCLATMLVVVGWRPLWQAVGGFFADPLLLAAVLVAVVVLTAASLAVWRWVRGEG